MERRRRLLNARAGRATVWLPAALIVLVLLTLLLVPPVVQRDVREAREEIQNAADPARTLVTAAAIGAAWLSLRVRRLAAEAEERRVLADRALAETARTVRTLRWRETLSVRSAWTESIFCCRRWG